MAAFTGSGRLGGGIEISVRDPERTFAGNGDLR